MGKGYSVTLLSEAIKKKIMKYTLNYNAVHWPFLQQTHMNLYMYVLIYFVILSYGCKYALNIWQSSKCKNFGECNTKSI